MTAPKPPGRIERRSSWTHLEPNRRLDPAERPAHHALEIVTGGKGNPRGFVREFGHAWLRLLTPQGDVYSVGFFPDESMGISPERRPGLRMPGMLVHPDKYDGLRYRNRVTRIPLTKARFDAVVEHLEGLQANREAGTLPFGLVDKSCVGFLVKAGEVAGVEIDASYDLLQAAIDSLPPRLHRLVPRRARDGDLWSGPTGPTARAIWRVYGLLFNLGLALLGGRRVEAAQWMREDGVATERSIANIRPVFERWRDVFGPPVPFQHIRSLIRWQDRFVAPADPKPDAEIAQGSSSTPSAEVAAIAARRPGRSDSDTETRPVRQVRQGGQ